MREVDARVAAQLDRIGYHGPAVIASRTVTDERGTRAIASGLYLPHAGLAAIRRADTRGTAASTAIMKAIAPAAASVAPDDVDPTHNTPPADLARLVMPSRLNGAGATQVNVNFSLSFIDFDDATGQWFNVPGGTILESGLRARDSSAGHWHGSQDTMQLRLPARVGRFVPASGAFTGSFPTVWRVGEVAVEVSTEFHMQQSGGPHSGQTDWFYSSQYDGVRVTGLQQIQPGAHYVLEGGTATHPEAFNDYATADMITRIGNVADAFYALTSKPATPTTPAVLGERTHVNDISLFYGGRFDVARLSHACSDAATGNCWSFSHFEHRLGTEVDIYNDNFGDPVKRAKFLNALQAEFDVHVEGTHFHARSSTSPYR
jgi:hypothetical protein